MRASPKSVDDGRFLTTFPEKVEEERDMVVVAIGVLRLESRHCLRLLYAFSKSGVNVEML
jgi:hypothetical protein